MKFLKDKEIKNAFLIGVISSIAYLVCYVARNLLSVVSPQMIESAGVSVEYIGTLSTAQMLFYAGGQLVNGIIGDKVKVKYMVGGGLVLSGICNVVIGLFHIPFVMLMIYGVSGFFLSMLYAPLVKLIAENTRPTHAEKCCLGLALACQFGAPVAGILGLFFEWNYAFLVCGCLLIVTGVVLYFLVVSMEKKGIIRSYKQTVQQKKKSGSIKVLLENSIVKFTFIAVLTGVIRTSVAFWVPTYLSQHLGFSAGIATTIFTVMTCTQSISPYVTNVLIYEYALKRRINLMLILMFGVSAIGFLLMFLVNASFVNIVFFIIAIMCANGASNVLWNVYCPSLHRTGMVSTATGFLDFMSYLAAAIANLLFANAVTQIGWGNLILIWAVLMAVGVLVVIPRKCNQMSAY